MPNTLFITCGVPASGKSTFIKKLQKLLQVMSDTSIVSRDEIRYSLLNDTDGYFSKEKEVYETFIQTIKKNLLKDNSSVIADATHLTVKSRRKLIGSLTGVKYNLIVLYFDVPLETCLSRNSARLGRARVPDLNVENMFYSLEKPKFISEKYVNEVWTINENGDIVEIEKRDS